MNNRNKKTITPIITALLLLIMVGVAFFSLERWYFNTVSEFEAKSEKRVETSKVGLLELKTNNGGSDSILGVKNYGSQLHEITKVKINGEECTILSTNVIESTDPVYVGCTVIVGNSYEVELYTNQGIFSRAFTVYE